MSRRKESFIIVVVVGAVGMCLSYSFLGSMAPLLLLMSSGFRTQASREAWNFVDTAPPSSSSTPHDTSNSNSHAISMSSGTPLEITHQQQPQQQLDHPNNREISSTTNRRRRRRIRADNENDQNSKDDSNDEDDGEDILDGIDKFFAWVISVINMILPFIIALVGLGGGAPADESLTDARE